MSSLFYFILGVFFLIYGIIKLILCYIELTPQKYHDISWLNKIFTDEKNTLADVFIYYILIVFAIFSLIKGAHWVGWINFHVGLMFYVILNLIFGIILVIFYSLVLYTKVPIPQDKDNKIEYQGVGLCTGLTFIATIPAVMYFYWFIKDKKITNFKKTLFKPKSLALIFITLSIIGLDLILFIKSGIVSNISTSIDTLAISLNAII